MADIRIDLHPFFVEEGPYPEPIPDGPYRRETCRTRSPKQSDQDGLGLIIHVVSRSDLVRTHRIRYGEEKIQSFYPRRLFDRKFQRLRNLAAGCFFRMKRQAALSSQVFHKEGVLVRIASPQSVVQVRYVERQPPFLTEL